MSNTPPRDVPLLAPSAMASLPDAVSCAFGSVTALKPIALRDYPPRRAFDPPDWHHRTLEGWGM